MTLLLDTHAFLWFCQDDPSLSTTAKALIEDPANRKLVSLASCWEIAIKAGLGKLRLGESSGTYIPAALCGRVSTFCRSRWPMQPPWNRCHPITAIRSTACWFPRH